MNTVFRYLYAVLYMCFLFQPAHYNAQQGYYQPLKSLHCTDTLIYPAKIFENISADSLIQGPNNIVFLLDISNSMARDKKMQLLHKSMRALLLKLKPVDRIHLITFGNTVNEVYSTSSLTSPDSLTRILEKIRSTASATNVNGGIQVSYDLIRKYFIKEGNNEVLIITDGEFILNKYTVEVVKNNPDIHLTAVIVGRGPSSEYAVDYVKNTLKLPVVTLVDESLDTEQLLKYFKEKEGKGEQKFP